MKRFNCQGEGHTARQCLMPKRKKDATWFKDKVLLVEVQGSGKVLNEDVLEFLADPGVAEGLVTQTVIIHNAAYQANDLDAYDSDCDDFFIDKAVLMANLSSYGSYVLSEVNKDNLIANESLSAEIERYKERVKLLEESQNVDLSTQEKLIMDDIIREKNAQFADFEKEINYLKQTLSDQSKEKELLTKTFKLNRLSEDFSKHFVPQQELSDEQAFRLQTSHPNTNQSASSPIKIEAPRELPKHITSDALTEGEWGFEHTKAVFLKEIIPFVKTLKDIFNVFDKYLLNEVMEVQRVFNQMEAAV
ncbi:hypothetical protein Tco_0728327 [Tanacetum coccineum]|uniref:CCHC-type domain-containing protein n=1 Tax=Tanacetum coccineum TaxID=301880 RepID=A0ABQ4YLX5_9ASTR